jgi:hypothetical protein
LAYQGKWIDDEDLKPGDVARVMGNKYVKEIYEKIKDKKQLTAEEREMIIEPIVEELKVGKKERKKLKKELKNKDQELEESKTEVGSLKKVIRSLRHLFGSLAFLVLWFVVYQFVLINSLEPWQAFIGSILIASIFGYLADLYGYKWLVEKLMGSAVKK